MRRLIAILFAALVVATGCEQTDTTCYLEGFEKHPCPSHIFADDGETWHAYGAVDGQTLFDWYGDLPPGVYTFVVEKDGGSDRVTFELG